MTTIEQMTLVNGTKCITFPPRNGETAYIRFERGSGCHAPVGYIGRKSSITIGYGCERKGTVMHEIMHALGFFHEVYTPGQPFDYDSIMVDHTSAFAIDRPKPTIVPNQPGVQIGQRTHLSTLDIQKIQLLYGCITTDNLTKTPINPINGVNNETHTHTNTPKAGTDYCSFQSNLCTWTQEMGDNTNWSRRHGSTPSSNTGPSRDHTGSTTNYYLYFEASGHANQYARITSKAYPGGDYCVDFYYHMFGAEMGTLTLNVRAGSQTRKVHTWSGNKGDRWFHQRASINIHTNGTFQFEFEGHTGSGFHSDMAIDDVTIHPGHC